MQKNTADGQMCAVIGGEDQLVHQMNLNSKNFNYGTFAATCGGRSLGRSVAINRRSLDIINM